MTYPEPTPAAPPPGRPPVLMMVLMVGLGLVGIVLLALVLVSVLRDRTSSAAPPPSPTRLPLLTEAVVIPTTTPAPPATATPRATATPAATEAPPTPEASATPTGFMITAAVPANIRSGPGFGYPVVAGLMTGEQARAIARDTSGTWLQIELAAAPDGLGWIATQVISLEGGDPNGLPAITPAAPPPSGSSGGTSGSAPQPTQPPANTPAPGNTQPPPPPASARGLTGSLRLCEARTTYAVGERICFVELIKNTTSGAISYGILGVQAANAAGGTQFQTSWSGAGHAGGVLYIDPGCEGPMNRCDGQWEDGIRLQTAGSYQLRLSICYSSFDTCASGGGDWETLTAPIAVQVQ